MGNIIEIVFLLSRMQKRSDRKVWHIPRFLPASPDLQLMYKWSVLADINTNIYSYSSLYAREFSQLEPICSPFWPVYLVQHANNRNLLLMLTQRFLLFHNKFVLMCSVSIRKNWHCVGSFQYPQQMGQILLWANIIIILWTLFSHFCGQATNRDSNFWNCSSIQRELCNRQPQHGLQCNPFACFCNWQADIVIISVWQHYDRSFC